MTHVTTVVITIRGLIHLAVNQMDVGSSPTGHPSLGLLTVSSCRHQEIKVPVIPAVSPGDYNLRKTVILFHQGSSVGRALDR